MANKEESKIYSYIHEYEKTHPAICGSDTLVGFIKWYDEKTSKTSIIEKTREQLFGMQDAMRDATGQIGLMSTNTAPKLAVEKCIEMANYFLGNTKEFGIEFDTSGEESDEDDDEDLFDDDMFEDD